MFVREINSSLQFALSQIRGFEPECMVVFGPGCTDNLIKLLKDAVQMESVIHSDPFDVHGIEFSSLDKSSGSWEIPLGLALRDI